MLGEPGPVNGPGLEQNLQGNQPTVTASAFESTPTLAMIEALPAMWMLPPSRPMASTLATAVAFPLTELALTKLVF